MTRRTSSVDRFNALRAVLAAAFLLLGSPAAAQMYSWKDPVTGMSRFSNIPPPWYSTGETVNGPRVVLSYGSRVVDDTALSYEERLLLSGKTREQIEKLRLQKRQDIPVRPQQDAVREPPARTDAGTMKRGSASEPPAASPPDSGRRS